MEIPPIPAGMMIRFWLHVLVGRRVFIAVTKETHLFMSCTRLREEDVREVFMQIVTNFDPPINTRTG